MMAICGVASTITGITMLGIAPPPQLPIGNQPSSLPNASCSSGAVTKLGMQMPTTATDITVKSAAPFCRSAAITPRFTPAITMITNAASPIFRLT